jgi:hypothetical protein
MSEKEAKFKRYLIHQDNETLKEILSDKRYFDPLLLDLKKAYEALEIEDRPFDTGVFLFIKESGVQQIVEIYTKALSAGLDETGVKNNKLRDFVLQGSEVPIAKLHQAYTALKSFKVPAPNRPTYSLKPERTATLSIEDINFIDGTFTVTDASKETLLEKYCRIYIEDEQQHAIYENLKALKSGLMEYERWIGQLGISRSMYGGHYTDSLDQFIAFDRETKEMSIIPQSVAWAQGLKAYQKKMYESSPSFRG